MVHRPKMLYAARHAWREKLIIVRVAYDPEAKVWRTESSDLFGLNAWASSLDEFGPYRPE
jgi:hypothetical protein